MRKVTVAALAVASLAAVPASAADMPLPSPTPYYPPPVRPAFSWTGCYVGAIVGGGWVDNQFTGGPFMDTAVPGTLPGAATVASLSNTSINLGSGGVLAGGQVGCDVQLGSPFVVGIAADGNWANLSGSETENVQTTLLGALPNEVPTTFSSSGQLQQKTEFLATLTARFGYAWAQGLFYIKGGGAWDKNTYSFNGTATTTTCASITANVPPPGSVCNTFNTPTTQSFNFTTSSETRAGWTAGLGMEWAFGPNFSINAEYDFVDFGTKSITFNGGPAFPSTTYSNRQFINELKLGFNARFGGY